MTRQKIMIIILVICIGISIPIIFNSKKGENNMATITPIEAGQSGEVIKTSINANFSEINEELEDGTTAIGDLTTLETTEKSNLVEAINEVNTFASAKVSSIYGEMWSNPSAMNALTLVSGNTWYSYSSGLELKYGSGITYESNSLKIATTGRYLVTYTLSISASVADADLYVGILKNGSSLANGQTYNVFKNAFYPIAVSCSFIESFNANDLIKLGFKKDSSASFSIDGYFYHLTITKV